MQNQIVVKYEEPDPAAVFGAAMSLWQECCQRADTDPDLNLSDVFNGMDQFMRVVMRIANQFEQWACQHVEFEAITDVWPYLLQEKFGPACCSRLSIATLEHFDDADCLRVALFMRLPVRAEVSLPVPIYLRANNPVAGSEFKEIQIQTVRSHNEADDFWPFVADDEPFDDDFGPLVYAIYGIGHDGLLEHIANRETYAEILKLAQKLSPGIDFPKSPIFQSE